MVEEGVWGADDGEQLSETNTQIEQLIEDKINVISSRSMTHLSNLSSTKEIFCTSWRLTRG